jgi:hypothetical protein
MLTLLLQCIKRSWTTSHFNLSSWHWKTPFYFDGRFDEVEVRILVQSSPSGGWCSRFEKLFWLAGWLAGWLNYSELFGDSGDVWCFSLRSHLVLSTTSRNSHNRKHMKIIERSSFPNCKMLSHYHLVSVSQVFPLRGLLESVPVPKPYYPRKIMASLLTVIKMKSYAGSIYIVLY